MQNKRLIKKTGLYFIGNLSSKILTFLLVPIYAFYVQSEDLGYYDYAQTIINIAVPICFAAIWEAILKFVIQADTEEEKNKIIASSAFFTLLAAFAVTAVMMIYGTVFPNRTQALYYIIAIMISYAVMFIWQYYARALGENKIYVLTGIIGTIVNFGLNILLICGLGLGLSALFISYAAGNTVIVIILELRLKILRRIRLKSVDLSILKSMLKFSLPLVLNLISTWLITGFGRIIIKENLGAYTNGMYAFANKFAIVITMLGSVINMAIIEEALLSAKKEGIGKGFSETIELLFQIFQSIIIAAAPVICIFYYIIRNTEYQPSIIYFPMLLVYSLVMIMAASIGTIFQVINKTKYQFITTVLGSAVTVVISLLFIEAYELHAVVIAQMLGAFAMLISRYILVNRYTEFKIRWKPIAVMFLFYAVVAYLCVFLNILFSILALIICTAVLAFINRSFILKCFKLLQR